MGHGLCSKLRSRIVADPGAPRPMPLELGVIADADADIVIVGEFRRHHSNGGFDQQSDHVSDSLRRRAHTEPGNSAL